jgi:molecular chaperone DnaK
MDTLTDEKRAALRLRLKVSAEDGKIKLCDSPAPDAAYRFQIATVDVFQGRPIVFNEELTRPMFEEMIRPLLENSLKWIDGALAVPKKQFKYQESHITAVLLVGGSTRIPLVREVLEKRFAATKTPIWGAERGINPDEIVAMGASIVAAEMDPEGEGLNTGTVLVDVTGHTLSVAAMDEKGRKSLTPIINKETPIACSGSHRFSSMGNFQTTCRIEVYQGEGTEIVADRVTMIGAFDISLRPAAEPVPLAVGLELNEDGILTAHATDESTGLRVVCRMDFKIDKSRMSPDEVARRKAQLEKQMQEIIAQTANPLNEPVAGGPQPAARVVAAAATPVSAASATAPADPLTLMNPIMRTQYSKALNSFARVPADRQNELVNIVTAIDAAARAGDAAKVNSYLPQLSTLLAGVD